MRSWRRFSLEWWGTSEDVVGTDKDGDGRRQMPVVVRQRVEARCDHLPACVGSLSRHIYGKEQGLVHTLGQNSGIRRPLPSIVFDVTLHCEDLPVFANFALNLAKPVDTKTHSEALHAMFTLLDAKPRSKSTSLSIGAFIGHVATEN